MFQNKRQKVTCIGLGLLLSVGTLVQARATDVTTHHYDNKRTGWNREETVLTPASLHTGHFKQKFSVALDGQVDAQPLIAKDIEMAGNSYEVAYVVTEANTVYAVDTQTGTILVQRNLGTPVEAGQGKTIDCGNNSNLIGITGTPVIDKNAHKLFVVAFINEADGPVYRLFALDLSTLADAIPSKKIEKTEKLENGEDFSFTARVSRQRPALTLANGNVYAAFGSFCDHDADKMRGWVLGWKADDLQMLPATLIMDKRGNERAKYHLASIWMAGVGPAADDNGDLYFITGNSRPDTPNPAAKHDPTPYLAESVVKVSGDLTHVEDYFTPKNVKLLDILDNDFGSGGLLLMPHQTDETKDTVVAAGKIGDMFLLDGNNLGKFDPVADHAFSKVAIGKCWCGQTAYIGPDKVKRVIASGGNILSSWLVPDNPSGGFHKEWDAQSSLGAQVWQKGFFTSVSSNYLQPDTAVIWAVQRPTVSPPNLTLWAFDAKTGATLLALPAGGWPNVGGSANTIPVVANGHVYVASNKELKIFGFDNPEAVIASISEPSAPAEKEDALKVFGEVQSTKDSSLIVKTPQGNVKVDIKSAVENHKVVTLTPGTAITVYGSQGSGGGISANAIEYAPSSPALWGTSTK